MAKWQMCWEDVRFGEAENLGSVVAHMRDD